MKNRTVQKNFSTTSNELSSYMYAILFFFCFFVYTWLVIDPKLIYHGFGLIVLNYSEFAIDWAFFENSLTYPGGIIDYVTGFLSQMYYFSWLGALIIACAAFLLWLVSYMLISNKCNKTLNVLCFIPSIIILMLYNRHSHPLELSLSLLVVLFGCAAYSRLVNIFQTKASVRFVLTVILFSLLYYVAEDASLLFAFYVVIHDFKMKQVVPAICFLLIVIVFILAEIFIFDVKIEPTFLRLVLSHSKVDSYVKYSLFVFYLFFPLLFLFCKLSPAKSVNQLQKKYKDKKEERLFIKVVCRAVVPYVLVVLAILISFDKMSNRWIQMNYYSRNNMWDQLLNHAGKLPLGIYNINVCHDINRALYHKGLLADEMFSFSQRPEALLLTSEGEIPAMKKWKICEIFTELGDLNFARHMAAELLEIQGNLPFVTERLALIEIARGNSQSAEIYLNTLAKDIIYRKRAKEMLAQIKSNPAFENDQQIQHLRAIMLDTDDPFLRKKTLDYSMRSLLESNKNNRMAFEYLMAYYLLTGQVDKLAVQSARFKEFGYKTMPRHYQEAVLIYLGSTGQNADMAKWSLDLSAIKRYEAFVRAYMPVQSQSRQQLINMLSPVFGNDYFFYNVLGVSGMKR